MAKGGKDVILFSRFLRRKKSFTQYSMKSTKIWEIPTWLCLRKKKSRQASRLKNLRYLSLPQKAARRIIKYQSDLLDKLPHLRIAPESGEAKEKIKRMLPKTAVEF